MGSYSNPGASISFHSLANVVVGTGTHSNSWINSSAAAGVPAGAKMMRVGSYVTVTNDILGVRPTGVAAGQQMASPNGTLQNTWINWDVELDVNGKFDFFDPTTGTPHYVCLGYWS